MKGIIMKNKISDIKISTIHDLKDSKDPEVIDALKIQFKEGGRYIGSACCAYDGAIHISNIAIFKEAHGYVIQYVQAEESNVGARPITTEIHEMIQEAIINEYKKLYPNRDLTNNDQ